MVGLKPYTIFKREGGWLFVTCPRKDCKKTFAVRAKLWAEAWHGHGRACPYCFRPSKLPAKRARQRNRSGSAKVSDTSQSSRSS